MKRRAGSRQDMVRTTITQPDRYVPRRYFLRLTGAAIAAPTVAGVWPGSSANAAHTSVVVSTDFGFDPEDSTQYLQAALDSSAHDVIIDRVFDDETGELVPWITGPLFVNRDDVNIHVEPGVQVRAKAGAFPVGQDSLITIIGRTGVSLVGYGATFAMNKPEYTTGEHRMAVRLHSVSDFHLEGLTLRDSGGDGVYVGVGEGLPPYCSNVTLRNVTCDNNKRNALSVISVDGLLAEGCAFINSNGAVPMAGVDFEPNTFRERLQNITLRDCVFAGNERQNVLANLGRLDGVSPPVSILLDRVYLGVQGPQTRVDPANFQIIAAAADDGIEDPGGTIEVRDALIENTPRTSCVLVGHNKAHDSLQVKFTRTGFWAWDSVRLVRGPFGISTGVVQGLYGNLSWTDSSLVTNDEDVEFLHPHLEPSYPDCVGKGLANLQGDLTVVNPNGTPRADYGACPHDIGLEVKALTSAPAQTVGVIAKARSVRAGRSTTLTFYRKAEDLSDSLAIAYELSGTAVQRYDYDGLAGVAVIPAGRRSVKIALDTRRQHDRGLGARVLNVTIRPFASYTVDPPGRVNVKIKH